MKITKPAAEVTREMARSRRAHILPLPVLNVDILQSIFAVFDPESSWSKSLFSGFNPVLLAVLLAVHMLALLLAVHMLASLRPFQN